MGFNIIVPERPQSEVRDTIDVNFDNAVVKPEGKISQRLVMVGVTSAGQQQAYIGNDGTDYLSDETGLLKNPPDGSQTVTGDLFVGGKITCGSLKVSPGGATIIDHLIVRNVDNTDNSSLSFEVRQDKYIVMYGDMWVRGTSYHTGTSAFESEVNMLANANVTGALTARTGSFTSTLSSGSLSTGAISASSISTTGNITAGGTLRSSGATIVGTSASPANLTVYGVTSMPNPGSPTSLYVRPLRAGTANVSSSLAYGTLYGQY